MQFRFGKVTLFSILFIISQFGVSFSKDINFGFGVGISKALGDGSEYWNMGFNGSGNLYYSLSNNVSIGGNIVYNRWGVNEDKVMSELRSFFPSEYSVGGISGSTTFLEISPVIRLLTTRGENQKIQFFGQAGLGYYIMSGKAQYDYSFEDSWSGFTYSEDGNVFIKMEENKIGLNFGAGIIIHRTSNVSFEINPIYHIIFTEEESTKYFTINFGIIFGN